MFENHEALPRIKPMTMETKTETFNKKVFVKIGLILFVVINLVNAYFLLLGGA
jgi:ABC-type phosphate transport system permease subunit